MPYRKIAGVWFLTAQHKGDRTALPRELAELLAFQGIVKIDYNMEAQN